MPSTTAGRLPLRRISSLDASNLRVESRGLPMTVAALMVLDPDDGHAGSSAAVDLEAIRGQVASRVAREPRLREVLLPTRWWQGSPVWVTDVGFDVGSRVRSAAVPSPGDEAALLRLCCDLSGPALDPMSSPWEMWVITGRDDGSVGVLLRLHHVVADGAAALGLFSALFDPAPDPAQPTGQRRGMPGGRPPGIPHPGTVRPRGGELALDNLRRSTGKVARTARRLGPAMRPRSLSRWAIGTMVLTRMLLAHGRAPALSLNQPVMAGPRELRLVRADLAAVRAAAHVRGATVNDLLLAVVAQGVRGLLQTRGELVPGLVLHVSVPASLRRAGETAAAGNRVAVRPMWVPLDESDPALLLAALAPTTRAVKRLPPLQPSGALGQRWVTRVMRRQRLVNLIVSNVAGPPEPLWFAGRRIREVFQIGLAGVQGNLSITVGALSYAGQLNLDVAVDATLVPDVEVFAQGVSDALRDLGCLRGPDLSPAPGVLRPRPPRPGA